MVTCHSAAAVTSCSSAKIITYLAVRQLLYVYYTDVASIVYTALVYMTLHGNVDRACQSATFTCTMTMCLVFIQLQI